MIPPLTSRRSPGARTDEFSRSGTRATRLSPSNSSLNSSTRLKAAGHAAKLIEVEGKGSQHHGVEQFSLPVAGACLNGVTDESIVWAVAREQSAGRQQQALAQLGWQYRKLKPAAAGTKPSDPRTLAGVVRPSAVAANDERDCANRKGGGPDCSDCRLYQHSKIQSIKLSCFGEPCRRV